MFSQGKSKSDIARELQMRRATIIDWLEKEAYTETRGWKSGTSRKSEEHTQMAERIVELKQKRIDEKKYFVGSQYVRMDYIKKYPTDPKPSIWQIDEAVREAKLQSKKPHRKKQKGGSKYLLYPTASVKRLGEIQQSVDFIGKKYIAGCSTPINIFSSSYYTPFKLFQIKRILAEKSIYTIDCLKEQWRDYPIPNVLREDNGVQFRGTSRGKRCLGMFLKFLLNLDVTPLFGAPSKPWTNPYVEGHNRVFGEKVWGSHQFTSIEQIEHECNRFNEESKEYFAFAYGDMIANNVKRHRYLEKNQGINTDLLLSKKGKRIYFLRFVESLEPKSNGYIIILNEHVTIPEKYTHQFVFVEWNLETERLLIYSESDGVSNCIKQIKFRINL